MVLGRATAGAEAVAAGATASATDSSVVLGAATVTGQPEQVALGRAASAAAGPDGAVVVGSGVSGPAANTVTVAANAQVTSDGKVILGQGTLPDLSWVNWSVAILGNAVAPRFFAARKDVVLAGAGSTLGMFGAAGATQPLVSTSGVTTSTPGRAALLSLMAALDQLGLVYLLDSAVDDELADFTKSFAHDANIVLETGDSDGSKAGDTTRARRSAATTGTITYQRTAGLRDFRARVFAYQPGGANLATLGTELSADVSPDNTVWTPLPLAWQSLTATAASWYQTWVANARPVPAGMKYLRLTLKTNSNAATPQLGRVITR